MTFYDVFLSMNLFLKLCVVFGIFYITLIIFRLFKMILAILDMLRIYITIKNDKSGKFKEAFDKIFSKITKSELEELVKNKKTNSKIDIDFKNMK